MKYISEIFQRLSRGQFISANSVDSQVRALFADLEDDQQAYADYFSKIGFELCAGDGYYYFSRPEQKVVVENKLQGLLPWIDYLDFLKAYDTSFDVGTMFSLSQIEVRLSGNMELREKLQALFPDKPSFREKIETLAQALVSMGFAEQVNEVEDKYQVTSAFQYIEQLIDCLNINEEVKDEIPE